MKFQVSCSFALFVNGLVLADTNLYTAFKIQFDNSYSFVSTVVDSSSGIYLAGVQYASNQTAAQSFLMKTDVNGTQYWFQNIGVPGGQVVKKIALDTSSGNVYAVGQATQALNGMAVLSTGSGFLVQYASDGTMINANVFGANTGVNDAFSVSVDPANEFVLVCGLYNGLSALYDFDLDTNLGEVLTFSAQYQVSDIALQPDQQSYVFVGHMTDLKAALLGSLNYDGSVNYFGNVGYGDGTDAFATTVTYNAALQMSVVSGYYVNATFQQGIVVQLDSVNPVRAVNNIDTGLFNVLNGAVLQSPNGFAYAIGSGHSLDNTTMSKSIFVLDQDLSVNNTNSVNAASLGDSYTDIFITDDGREAYVSSSDGSIQVLSLAVIADNPKPSATVSPPTNTNMPVFSAIQGTPYSKVLSSPDLALIVAAAVLFFIAVVALAVFLIRRRYGKKMLFGFRKTTSTETLALGAVPSTSA